MKRILLIILIILLFLISLKSYIISAYKMHKTTSITYSDSGFGITLDSYKIDFESHTAYHYGYDFDGQLNCQQVRSLNTLDIISFKAICVYSKLPLWKEIYEDPEIVDGAQWDLYRFEGSTEYKTFGSNASPSRYYLVYYYIYELFD